MPRLVRNDELNKVIKDLEDAVRKQEEVNVCQQESIKLINEAVAGIFKRLEAIEGASLSVLGIKVSKK